MNTSTNSTGNHSGSLLVRAAFLAVWVALLDLWLARHFHTGVGLQELSLLIGVPLGSLWCAGVIDFLVDKEDKEAAQKNLKTYFRHFIRNHLSVRVLTLLFLGGLLLSATYSTVSIGPGVGTGVRKIVLTPIGSEAPIAENQLPPGQVKDVHLWINPLAAHYQLSVSGYLPIVIGVNPFVGTMVIPDRDLVPIPTVLFRPSFGSYTILGSGGWFELYRRTENGFEKIAEDRGTHAWYIGPHRNQPSDIRSEWPIETKALGLGEQSTAILMQRWRNPKKLDVVALGPQEVICAVVTNIDRNVVIAGVVGRIVNEDYIDLPLGDLQNETVNLNSANTGDAVCAWLDAGAS